MKLTKEDIKKYGTADEKALLKEFLTNPYTAEDFEKGDYVTFMNNRRETVDGVILKKFDKRAKVKDLDCDDVYLPQYSQLAKLDNDRHLLPFKL